ncbi:hypothetical protein GF342_05015 [Candidatus Woesearchaeota archaeon]|nr:hypothetical protein [Candidatus Woesearchaeota archaeon]
MARNELARKGQTNLMWWLFYFGIAAVLLSAITYLGVSMYTVHSTLHGLQSEIIFQRAIQELTQPDPYSDRPELTISSSRLTAMFDSEKQIAMRVQVGNNTYYSNKDLFEIMLERGPIVHNIREKKTKDYTFTMVISRT